MPKWGGDGSLTISADNGNPVFVLLGPQMENLGILQQMYPGGEVVTGPTYEAPINGPAFVAYLPPAPPDGT